MSTLSRSEVIGLLGIVLTVVLLVLDKAGKLKGQWLIVLLFVAAVMTVYMALGFSWVTEAPSKWKLWRSALMFCVVAFAYSGIAIWIISESKETGAPRQQGDLGADITWDFDSQDQRSYFLGMSGGQIEEPLVILFQARGRNNLDEPITHVNGFVRSDITNTEFPIRIVGLVVDGRQVRPEDAIGVPRKAEFTIASDPFPTNDPQRYSAGLNASKFLVEFATFTFVFQYDGKRFVRHFANEEIWKTVEAFRRASLGFPPLRSPPSGPPKQP